MTKELVLLGGGRPYTENSALQWTQSV